MASRRRSEEVEGTRRRPATTPEARENEMVAMAFDAIEARIRNREASSQELVHFAKLGSSRERLEQQRLEYENKLTQVKIEAAAGQKEIERLYINAITAMRSYSGQAPLPEEDEDDPELY